jgi:CubicO group peptidase (beta-lactamase class C family)
MTKIVTATAVMQLVEEGALSLDDPVNRYVSAFPAPRSGWPTVKVRHLLSHSSGLANPMPVRWVHPADERGRDPSEFAAALLRKQRRLKSPAGSRAAYSNLGYIALGEVVGVASGTSFEEHVHSRILDPLGMRSSGFVVPPEAEDVAAGYQRRFNPMTPLFRALLPKDIMGKTEGSFVRFRPFLVDGPAYGGLVGPVRDAVRFMGVHLNDGLAGTTQILAPESVRAMQTSHARGRKMEVGYGWKRRLSDRAPADFWEHLGGGGGYWSMMRIYPEAQLGVVSMGNATSYDHASLAEAVRSDVA